MADATAVSGAAITIGQTVVAYQFFLPRLSDVRRASDDEMRRDVYLGQIAAAAVSLAVGSLLAWMGGSAVPIYVTVVIALIIAGVYHYAMESNHATD